MIRVRRTDRHHACPIVRETKRIDPGTELHALDVSQPLDQTPQSREGAISRLRPKIVANDSEVLLIVEGVDAIIAEIIPGGIRDRAAGDRREVSANHDRRLFPLGHAAEQLRRETNLGNPHTLAADEIAHLAQIADERLLLQAGAVGVNGQLVEPAAQLHRLADEIPVHPRRRTPQNDRVGILRLDRRVCFAQQSGIHFLGTGPEADIRLVVHFPVSNPPLVMPHHFPSEPAVILNAFVRVGFRPARPVGQQAVNTDSMLAGGVDHLIIERPIEFASSRLQAAPVEFLARPLDAGPLRESCHPLQRLAHIGPAEEIGRGTSPFPRGCPDPQPLTRAHRARSRLQWIPAPRLHRS